jgi:hypothetical protein
VGIIEGHPRPEGMAALRYHGMLQGLIILLRAPDHPIPAQRCAFSPLAQQGAFVRQLANLVLHAHSEITHVC